MRLSLSKEKYPLRNALIGAILIFCFEGFQGNHNAATPHIRGGYKLLKGQLATNSSTSRPSVPVEEDLIHAFCRLDLQSMLVVDSQQVLLGRRPFITMDWGKSIEKMPSQFLNLAEAHQYWGIVMWRCSYFLHSASALVDTPILDGSQDNLSINIRSVAHQSFPNGPIPSEILLQQRKYLEENACWQAAFRHLLLTGRKSDRHAAALLQFHAVGQRLVLEAASVAAVDECAFDTYLPEFRKMLSLAKTFFAKSPSEQGREICSLDIGVIPGLYAIVRLCRNGSVRREALGLLRDFPRREGVWDSLLVAGIGQWIMEVEEEGLEGGFVPERARAGLAKVEVDILNRSATLEYSKRAIDRGVVSLQKTIPSNAYIAPRIN